MTFKVLRFLALVLFSPTHKTFFFSTVSLLLPYLNNCVISGCHVLRTTRRVLLLCVHPVVGFRSANRIVTETCVAHQTEQPLIASAFGRSAIVPAHGQQ